MFEEHKKFTKINESFVCENPGCGRAVPKAKKSCRNHCPFCLYSKHVDQMPGDRQEICGGLMQPISYTQEAKKGIVLTFRCLQCGIQKKNKAALKGEAVQDDYDLILKL